MRLSKDCFAKVPLQSYLGMHDDEPPGTGPHRVRVTDPEALRALAHPIRLSLMALAAHAGSAHRHQGGRAARRELRPAPRFTCGSWRSTGWSRSPATAMAGNGRGERPSCSPTSRRSTNDPKVASGVRPDARRRSPRTTSRQLRRWLADRDDEPEEWQRAAHVRRHDDLRHRRGAGRARPRSTRSWPTSTSTGSPTPSRRPPRAARKRTGWRSLSVRSADEPAPGEPGEPGEPAPGEPGASDTETTP